MPASRSETRHLRPALFLDYGADAVDAETAACELCERGMRFRSQWQFDLGAVLRVAFAFDDRTAPQRIEAEGMVVECAIDGTRIYQTTLAFLDTPTELRSCLCEVSNRLESPLRSGSSSRTELV